MTSLLRKQGVEFETDMALLKRNVNLTVSLCCRMSKLFKVTKFGEGKRIMTEIGKGEG